MVSSVPSARPNGGLLQADNASIVYLDLARPRAAYVGNAYFQRFGISMLLRYRPGRF